MVNLKSVIFLQRKVQPKAPMSSPWSLKIIVLAALLMGNLMAMGQARSGIYLTTNLDLEICDHKMKLLNEKTVFCVSEEPILEVTAFENISEISYDSVFQMRQFKITLTALGATHVNTVAEKLPDHKMAVVVDGKLISVINLSGIYNARSIVIWDEFDSHAMEWIHKSLMDDVGKTHKKS